MFEKEAEEYADKQIGCGDGYYEWTDVEHAFKDGAEFGYNKAKVEVEESYIESLCNSELNLASVTEQLEELEKANGWHYVKDGDLPKENKKYWILTSNREPKVDSWLTVSWVYSYDVIAWKEIVLPELKESK